MRKLQLLFCMKYDAHGFSNMSDAESETFSWTWTHMDVCNRDTVLPISQPFAVTTPTCVFPVGLHVAAIHSSSNQGLKIRSNLMGLHLRSYFVIGTEPEGRGIRELRRRSRTIISRSRLHWHHRKALHSPAQCLNKLHEVASLLIKCCSYSLKKIKGQS